MVRRQSERPPTAILIIRLWSDRAPASDFRATIIARRDVEREETSQVAVASRRGVIEAVEAWLRQVTGDPDAPGGAC